MKTRLTPALLAALSALLLSFSTLAAQQSESTLLSGQVGEISSPDSVSVGTVQVRLRDVYVFDDKRAEALEFMRSLAARGREIECRLSGERFAGPDGRLVGDCVLFGPTDGREIDLGERLLERGFARACEAPDAMITVWPPVYGCQ